MSATTQLGIFAKYWEPGRVKTRLAAAVGDRLAAEFHCASLSALLAEFANFPASRVLAFAPPDREPEFLDVAGDAWRLQPQAEGNLGQRMAAYFQAAFESGMTRVVLIGSDSPHLRQATIRRAIEVLNDVSVTLGPTEDGGYYLIAGRPDMPDLFQGIEWSTPSVWQRSVRRLEFRGARWHQLEESFDVDEVGDVATLLPKLPQEPQYDALEKVCRRCLDRADSKPA